MPYRVHRHCSILLVFKGQEEPPLSDRIARTLFAVESGVMVLLHGFIKKTRATPQAEIDLAEKRYKEWKHGEK